jgi:hypothetical protein
MVNATALVIISLYSMRNSLCMVILCHHQTVWIDACVYVRARENVIK